MDIVELNPKNFDDVVSQAGIVVVDCWAAWCGPCRSFEPVFERAASKHGEHQFAKLDTVAHEELTQTAGVEHIPTLLVYRDGILLLKQPGTMSGENLSDIIEQAERLDMALVRADIAAARAASDADVSS